MDQEQSPRERRQYPRINKKIRFDLKANEHVVQAESINLSGNGVYCRVEKPIELMATLRIVMTLAYDQEHHEVEFVECQGVVVRVEETEIPDVFNIAIYFMEMEDKERRKLSAFIHHHM